MSVNLEPHEFRFTPHVYAILKGRGMCKEDRLLCVASKCLFQPVGHRPDSDYGRDIEIKGFGICQRCGAKTDYASGIEWDDGSRKVILKCNICKSRISKKFITWTQIVVSKHRKSKHFYYHKECYDAKFIDVPDDDDDESEVLYHGSCIENTLFKIIKWIVRVERNID